MNRISIETARTQEFRPEDSIYGSFGAAAEQGLLDALFLDAGKSKALGVAGLPFYMPVCTELVNIPEFLKWVDAQNGSILIVWDNGQCSAYRSSGEQAELSIEAAQAVSGAISMLTGGPGVFN